MMLAVLLALLVGSSLAASRPNVIFILTDDQDLHLNSLDYLPHVQSRLVEKGTFYQSHYCTNALCCPSRVSIWTGKAAHNHNVTNVVEPYGGYPKFISQGLNNNWLPVWLQNAGYNNYYVGKLFNSHTLVNYFLPFPAGFKGTDFLLDPNQYSYWNPAFQRNLGLPVIHNNEYSTDLVANKSLDYLDDAVKEQDPFFLTIAPIAPHVTVNVTIDVLGLTYHLSNGPPMPATRHLDLFNDAIVPRTSNFNPSEASGASWVKQLPILNDTEIARNDEFYRDRLRALQAVDELVDRVFVKLEDYGILNNTYVFFSSDNGFHIGQHRLQPGKKCPYEEDINVPLIVRGPGIAEGASVDFPTSHLDLAPTFLNLLGIPLRDDFDGSAIDLLNNGTLPDNSALQEHVQVEFWGTDDPNEWEAYASDVGFNNTYKALRIIGENYNLYYSVWCTNEHELYDMTVDPAQMNNLYGATGSTLLGVPITSLIFRLDSLLLVLKSCKGDTCRDPWEALLPGRDVSNLIGALDASYDAFFEQEVPRVSFSACVGGYITSYEGPQFEDLSIS